MALFNFKKGKDKKSEKPKEKAVALPKKTSSVPASNSAFHPVLLRPRVTEKVSSLAEKRVYTFDVTNDATKGSVSDAVSAVYKVVPTKIRIVPIPRKQVFVRGKRGVTGGGKKAYVYLKEGDKIEIS